MLSENLVVDSNCVPSDRGITLEKRLAAERGEINLDEADPAKRDITVKKWRRASVLKSGSKQSFPDDNVDDAELLRIQNRVKVAEETVSKVGKRIKEQEKMAHQFPGSTWKEKKKQPNKITAFGTTIKKDDVPVVKKKAMSGSRFGKSKRSKECMMEGEKGDDLQNKPVRGSSNTRMTPSKNKLTDMMEELKNSVETTPKRTRSPYRTAAKMDGKKIAFYVRTEGDPKGAALKHKEDGMPVIDKELTFFERLQQNLKAYFSPRTNEIMHNHEKQPIPEGGSFLRSKIFEKIALVPSTQTPCTTISFILEPDEQVEIVSSSDGMASAYSQVEELHQEIDPNEGWSAVNGESIRKWMKNRCQRSLRETHPHPSARTCKSTVGASGDLPLLRLGRRSKSCEIVQPNGLIRSVTLHNGIPDQIQTKKRWGPPRGSVEKTPFIPRKNWLVYSVTETRVIEGKSAQTPRRETTELSTRPELFTLGLTIESQSGTKLRTEVPVKKASKSKVEKPVPSRTLKQIIELSREIFESRNEADESCERISGNVQMGRYLDKLLEEKRNYLNLQKSVYITKAQKCNIIADSFNFFNTLNHEFLSVKSSNPRIEELRNSIKERKESKIEDYISLYKNVIRTSLSPSDQELMNKAKFELERCSDRYYDLMRCICAENSSDTLERTKLPSRTGPSSVKPNQINYYEIFKKEKKNSNVSADASYLNKFKTTIENSYYNTKMRETLNLDQNSGKSNKECGKNQRKLRSRRIRGEKANPNDGLGSHEGEKNVKDMDRSGQGKVLLKISMCDDGLIIQQVKTETEENSHADEVGLRSLSGANTSVLPSDETEKVASYEVPKVVSESTLYPKSSLDDEPGSESAPEHPKLAFQKLMGDGLRYLATHHEDTLSSERSETMKTKKSKEDWRPSIPRRELKKTARESCSARTRNEDKFKRSLLRPKISCKRTSSAVRSPGKDRKEGPPWWHETNEISSTTKSPKVLPLLVKRPDWSPRTKKLSLPTPGEESHPKRAKQGREDAKSDEAEEHSPPDTSSLGSPSDSFLEYHLGMKNLKELLAKAPAILNPGELTEGKLVCKDSEEEPVLRQTSLCKSPGKSVGNAEKQKEGVSKTTTSDWDKLVEASAGNDYRTIMEVLNKFMGNISEAWKAAVCLKGMIQSKDFNTDGVESAGECPRIEEETPAQGGQRSKRGTIDAFKGFLRIVTAIFEENQMEESRVKRELFLLARELIESCTAVSESMREVFGPSTGKRTRFAAKIAEIPEDVKEMIARELVLYGKSFSRSEETYEPNTFVTAVKSVGERLKEAYSGVKGPKEKKIYYRLPKSQGEPMALKSNLGSIVEKISRMRGEEKPVVKGAWMTEEKSQDSGEGVAPKKEQSLSEESSVYFDARDAWDSTENRNRVGFSDKREEVAAKQSSAEEGYFSLNSKTFARYRDMIYDKIFSFIKSENPKKFGYGITLLRKMMDRDWESTSKKPEGKKWDDLYDRLIEICQVLETEMKRKVETPVREEKPSEKELKLLDTCEYLRWYVERMGALLENNTVRSSPLALEHSRERNMERQLITASGLGRGGVFLENAIDLIKSFRNLRLDKFSNYFPNWMARAREEDDSHSSDWNEQLLQSNKIIVKSLKKKIEKRQKKLREAIDQSRLEGKWKPDRTDDKIMRQVKDLNKCYNLLEKMICDPTLLPPSLLKKRPKERSSVMTMLEDMLEQVGAMQISPGRRVLGCSQSAVSMEARNDDGEDPLPAPEVDGKVGVADRRVQTDPRTLALSRPQTV